MSDNILLEIHAEAQRQAYEEMEKELLEKKDYVTLEKLKNAKIS